MTEKEFLDFFNQIDENILKPEIKKSYEQGQDYYNKLISEGFSPDEALFQLIMETSYRSMRFAVMLTLFFCNNIDSEKPMSKKDLKEFFKVIK